MVRTPKKSVAFVAAATALFLGLTGCSAGATPSESAPGPERVYVEAISADPTGFNPQVAGGPNPLRFGFSILGTLVEMNDQYEVSPGLIEDWELSSDGLELTLKVRQGVRWHDGEPFTAEDVEFNLNEMVPLTASGAALAKNFESVVVEDESTVVVTMKSEYGPLMESLSQQAVLPKHLYEGTDYVTNPANMAPVGTGALMFESFAPGAEVVLVKNPDWWKGATEVDRAVFTVMPDPNARALALRSGEIDSTPIDPSQQDQIAQEKDLVHMKRGSFSQMIGLTFNARSEALADPEVRQLLFSAIDRDDVTELAINGLGSATEGFLPDSMAWAQSPEVDFTTSFPRDVEEIAAGLDRAGFPVGDDGWRMTLNLHYISALSDAAAAAEVIKSSLADVGVQVNLVGTAEPVFIDNVYTNPVFDLSLLRNTVGSDPSTGVAIWLTCNEASMPFQNGSGICDPQLDEAAQLALTTSDRAVRAQHLDVMQQRANELMYWAPIVWTNASFPTVNTSRWSNLADGETQTNSPPWAQMKWIG